MSPCVRAKKQSITGSQTELRENTERDVRRLERTVRAQGKHRDAHALPAGTAQGHQAASTRFRLGEGLREDARLRGIDGVQHAIVQRQHVAARQLVAPRMVGMEQLAAQRSEQDAVREFVHERRQAEARAHRHLREGARALHSLDRSIHRLPLLCG